MILDRIETINRYHLFNEDIDLTTVANQFKEGKFFTIDETLFALGLTYNTKPAEEGVWEAHRKYIDVHYLLEGEEIVHIAHIGNMASTSEYKDDYELFDGPQQYSVKLCKGDFLVLFPHEVHKTGIAEGERTVTVKKIVFKVAV